MQATTDSADTSVDPGPPSGETAVMPASYSRKVGERLRAIRRQKRLSLQEVEAASDAKPAQTAQPQITGTAPASQALPSQASATPQFKFDPYTGKPVESTTTTTSHT